MPVTLARKPLPKSDPKSDPRFRKVMEQLKQGAAKTKAHPPAAKKAAAAVAAAKAPPDERLAAGKAKQVDTIKEAKEGKPEPSSFLAVLRAEIDKAMPKTLGDTEKFMQGGASEQMKGSLKGNVSDQKDKSTKDVSGASKATPSPTGEAKPVTPLPAEGAPPAPNVEAAEAMPAPKSDADVSLQDSKQNTDDQLKDAEVTPTQLQKANDPRFSSVLEAKGTVAKQADAGPAKYRAAERGALTSAAVAAQGESRKGAAALMGVRTGSNAKVLTRQQQQKAANEAKLAQVTMKINEIFTATQTRVNTKLASLDTEVGAIFDQGTDAALAAMTSFVKDRLFKFKLDRYLSIPIVGAARWIRDQFLGLPDEVNVFYEQGRQVFQGKMDALIVRVAALVEQRLKEAKQEVARGQAEIKAFVESQPKDIQALAQKAVTDVTSKFAELEQGIEDKKNQLAEGLAQKYKESFDKANSALKSIQDENKGLVAAFVEKLGEIIKILTEMKAKLMAMLRKGADTIKIIIADPIAFLGNLIAAVKGGIQAFVSNIWTHLKRGFMQWLFGNLPPGVTIPNDLSLPSILKLVLGVLGITYDKMRAKAVKLIGERNVKIIEKLVGYIQTLISGGPAALWEQVKGDLSNLKAMVIEAIQNWLIETVIKNAVAKIISMCNPAGAIIQAAIAIYNLVIFVIEKAQQIMAFVESVINSVHAIATGAIGGAIKWIEEALGRTIPIVIGFLAGLIGLGGISQKIRDFIMKVQSKVDEAIDKVIKVIVDKVKKLFGKGGTAKADEKAKSPEVMAGLATLHALGRAKLKDGKLPKEDAETAAVETKRQHPVFKFIRVTAGEGTWDYKYAASPEDSEKGEPSREEVDVHDADVVPPSEKPKKSSWLMSMKIRDRKSPDIFFWGLIEIPIDADLGIPKKAPGPSMVISSRTTRADKSPVKLKLLGAITSWTDLGLHWMFKMHKEQYGTEPNRLDGSLAEKNLLNFQNEYLKSFWLEGLSRDAAAEAAIRRISYGAKRVALGFKLKTTVGGLVEEVRDVGGKKRKVQVPTGVTVVATR